MINFAIEVNLWCLKWLPTHSKVKKKAFQSSQSFMLITKMVHKTRQAPDNSVLHCLPITLMFNLFISIATIP